MREASGNHPIDLEGCLEMPAETRGKVIECAVDSFSEYPLFGYLCGGTYDTSTSRGIWSVLIGNLPSSALLHVSDNEVGGYAIWVPPGAEGMTFRGFLRSGGARLVLSSGFGVVRRLLSYDGHAARVMARNAMPGDWYLYNVGVRKDLQGQGLASRLLKPMLAHLDDLGCGCYLETHAEKNVGLYEHLGFSLVEVDEAMKEDGIVLYAMRRPPRPSVR